MESIKDKLSEYRQLFDDLTSQREILEIEADAINSELTSPTAIGGPPVGRSGPLTDAEGFPRADIDIYNVKSKRKRLAEINTDHKLLMKRIESTMTAIYNTQQEISSINSGSCSNDNSIPTVFSFQDSIRPLKSDTSRISAIAVIDEVFDGSPSQVAGIENGDELIDFGGVSADSDKEGRGHLSLVAKVVSGSVGQPIQVTIRRASQLIHLTLTPQTWSGRGLLGCHLSPKL